MTQFSQGTGVRPTTGASITVGPLDTTRIEQEESPPSWFDAFLAGLCVAVVFVVMVSL